MFSHSLHGVLERGVNKEIVGQHVCVAVWGAGALRKNVILTGIPGNSDEGGPETIY